MQTFLQTLPAKRPLEPRLQLQSGVSGNLPSKQSVDGSNPSWGVSYSKASRVFRGPYLVSTDVCSYFALTCVVVVSADGEVAVVQKSGGWKRCLPLITWATTKEDGFI